MHLRSLLLPLAVSSNLAGPAHADGRGGAWSAEWDLRARHEQVRVDGFAHEAVADTVRLRAGLRWKAANGWQALLEGEGVASAGDRYNSGANGRTAYPAVTDPASAEINQAWLGWRNATFGATVGRQRLQLDNQRFIGNSGWRQNEQTFDAVAVDATPRKGVTLRYAWLDRVHRVASDEARDPLARQRRLSTHLLNAAWVRGAQQFTGYGYLHKDRDVATASTATWGLRWTGAAPLREGLAFTWALDAARQENHANNPLRFSHDYWLVEPGLKGRTVAVRAGWEHLGGNGVHALQTPLATLHAFNGWADLFPVTPARGLEDRYIGLAGNAGRERHGARIGWAVEGHAFDPAHGSGRYGTEVDAMASLPIAKGVAVLAKFADYRADGFGRDTRKLWLQLEWKGRHPL